MKDRVVKEVLDRRAELAMVSPDREIEPEVREQEERGDQGKETLRKTGSLMRSLSFRRRKIMLVSSALTGIS